MSHAKDGPRFLNCSFHLDTIIQASGHGLFTKNMVSLFCKRQSDFEMHVVLYSDKDSVGESFPNRVDGFGRSGMQILPCLKNERLIDLMKVCKVFLSFWSWLRDRNNFQEFWAFNCVFRVGLAR